MYSQTASSAGMSRPPASSPAAAATASSIRPVRSSSIRQSAGTTTKSRSCGSRAAGLNQCRISMLPRSTSESAQPEAPTARRATSIAVRRARSQAFRTRSSGITGSSGR